MTIELNGSDASVHIGATIAQVIEDEGFEESCNPGNLLAVDDSIITRGGGERYTVTLGREGRRRGRLRLREARGR